MKKLLIAVLMCLPMMAQTYSMHGNVGETAVAATVTLSSQDANGNLTTVGTTTSDASGNYSFSNLANGNYVVQATGAGYWFQGAGFGINGANLSYPINLTAWPAIYSISGTVKLGTTPLKGVTMTLLGGPGGTTTTDANGNYSFNALPSSQPFAYYTVSVSGGQSNGLVSINNASVTVNFTETTAITMFRTTDGLTGFVCPNSVACTGTTCICQ